MSVVTATGTDREGHTTQATASFTVAVGGNWWDRPADASNTGYKHAPGYTGTLKPGPAASQLVAGATYTGLDIPSVNYIIGVDNVKFVGCRFHGASPQNANVILKCNNPTFSYCTFEPNVPFTPGVKVTEAQSYQYSISSGGGYGSHVTGLTMDHCDMWGFGNAVETVGNGPFLFDHCWLHDPCVDPAAQYHTDGIGYLNGIAGQGIQNMEIRYCTIESDGNTNGIACQQGYYQNLNIHHNYFGGWGFTVAIWSGSTNITFTDNVFSTEMNCIWGALYGTNFMTYKPGSTWARNRWHSKNPATGGPLGWGTPTHDGLFWYYTPGADISGNTPPVTQTDDSIFISRTDYPVFTAP